MVTTVETVIDVSVPASCQPFEQNGSTRSAGEPELWKLDAQLAERVGAFSGELPPFPSVRRRTFLSQDWWEWRG